MQRRHRRHLLDWLHVQFQSCVEPDLLYTRMPAPVERAHGFDEHNPFTFLHPPPPCFVSIGQTHWQEQAHPDMREPLLPLLLYWCSTYLPRQCSCRTSSCGTIWPSLDYKGHPGVGAQCQVGPSPECLFSHMYVSMTLMPNTHRKPTTVMDRRLSKNPSA